MTSKESTASPQKFSFKNVLAEIRNPTNIGSRFIKYSLLAIGAGLLYAKLLRPMRKEYLFYQDEEFANNVFEQEMEQQRSKTS